MISDLDIWRTAHVLVQQRGAEALSHAADRATDFAFKGDQQGALVWKRILEAVRELQRRERHAGEAIN